MYIKPKDLNSKAGKISNDFGKIPFLREDLRIRKARRRRGRTAGGKYWGNWERWK